MKKFESVVILNPKTKDEQIENFKQTMIEFINKNGKMSEIENLGKKKLAWAIKEETEGIYIDFLFYTNDESIDTLEKFYRDNNEVLKFMTVRCNSDDEDCDLPF